MTCLNIIIQKPQKLKVPQSNGRLNCETKSFHFTTDAGVFSKGEWILVQDC